MTEPLRECFTAGEGVGLECAALRKAVGLFSLLLLSLDRPKPNALLNADCALGVRGVVGGVVRLEEEGDVWAGVACFVGVEEFLETLVWFTEALLGDWLGLGDAILLVFAGVDEVILMCVIRLIGREDFSSDKGRTLS